MFEKSIVAVRPFKLALLASVALAAAGAAAPTFAASTTATASATVIVPIAIAKATDLSFGKFASGASAGSVTIKTDGTRTSSGVTEIGGGTLSAARFNITGEPNATYAIDTTATTANLTSGSDTLSLALVSDFAAAGASSGTQATGTLSGTGTQSLYVGGTLTVGANQPNGSYSGSVSVAVAYN
jgi:hypothetical protein